MKQKITATEAARNLSDVLNRVRYRRESFLIMRNGESVGVLSPIEEKRPKTLRRLVQVVKELGIPDDDFAADLEEIRRQALGPPEDPWPSS